MRHHNLRKSSSIAPSDGIKPADAATLMSNSVPEAQEKPVRIRDHTFDDWARQYQRLLRSQTPLNYRRVLSALRSSNANDNFAITEFHMTAESFESEPESELAYWKCRVANLEIVVCELLVKNERLRRELQMSIYPRSGQASAPMDSQKG